MKKWEYLIVPYTTEVNVDFLNKLGNEGWELIHKLPLEWIFKREKIEKVLPDQAD